MKLTKQKLKEMIREVISEASDGKWVVWVAEDAYGKNQKLMKVAKSRRAALIYYNKLVNTDKYESIGMESVEHWNRTNKPKVEEGKLTEKLSGSILKKAKKKSSDTYERTVYAANGNQFSFYNQGGYLQGGKYYIVFHGKKGEETKHIDMPSSVNKHDKAEKYFQSFMKKYNRSRKLPEGKLTEAQEPLWDKNTVKDAIKQIKKGLKNAVPYLDDIGTGFGGESIIGKISLDNKKDWPNGYIQNSRWALIHFFPDGTLDSIAMNGYSSYEQRKKVPKLRKSKNKTLRQAIDRMGRYFTVVRTKYPDKGR